MQHWIDHPFTDGNYRVCAVTDSLNELITIHLLLLEQPEDQKLRNSIHEIRIGFSHSHGELTIPRSSRHCKRVMSNIVDFIGYRSKSSSARLSSVFSSRYFTITGV